jgi:hypothetical protein
MTCADFQRELTGLLAGEPGGGRVDELRAHARDCETCGEAGDLLDWAALPTAERDPIDEPDAAYWDAFDERVHRRIAVERTRSPRSLRIWATAASLALVLLAGWWWWTVRDGAPDSHVVDGALRFDLIEVDEAVPPSVELPPDLEALLARAAQVSPDEASLAVGVTAWPGDDEDPGGVDPFFASLPDASVETLLEAFDGDAAATFHETISVGTGLAAPEWDRGLFPETSELDAGARQALLEWLESRSGA